MIRRLTHIASFSRCQVTSKSFRGGIRAFATLDERQPQLDIPSANQSLNVRQGQLSTINETHHEEKVTIVPQDGSELGNRNQEGTPEDHKGSPGDRTFYTEPYILKHHRIPRKEDVPNIPQSLFDRITGMLSPEAMLTSLLERSELEIIRERLVLEKIESPIPQYECRFRCKLRNGRVVKSIGHGQRLMSAEKAAALHLMVTLANSDLMEEALCGRLWEANPDWSNASDPTPKDCNQVGVALRIDNIEVFLDRFQTVNPGIKLSVKLARRGELSYAQVFLDNALLGNTALSTFWKRAARLAYLDASLHIVKESPELLGLMDLNSEQLKLLLPTTSSEHGSVVELGNTSFILMQKAQELATALGFAQGSELLEAESDIGVFRKPRSRQRLSAAASRHISDKLLRRYLNSQQRIRRDLGSDLPLHAYSENIIETVENNTYSVLIGATGSGKTTQVPQILLDQAIKSGTGASCNIMCTQPRRIAAKAVARRVAAERGQKLQDQIGYQVRYDTKLPRYGGSITYCTTGILLEQLKHDSDFVFDTISHLVIDEVHERDKLTDFLFILLKKSIAERKAKGKKFPKVMFMSATMDSELISSYFSDTGSSQLATTCPTIVVPRRTFEVETQYLDEILETFSAVYGPRIFDRIKEDEFSKRYLEVEKNHEQHNNFLDTADGEEVPVITWKEGEAYVDWKEEREAIEGRTSEEEVDESDLVPIALVAYTIAHIARTTEDGAILAFLPGMKEMGDVQKMLLEQNILGQSLRDPSKYELFLLHSDLHEAQTEVFIPSPPGIRKIILATNIAESSITVSDVQHVVDTGKAKIMSYGQISGITQLKNSWISKSNSQQRMGRAGRVQNGHYYALFSKARFESFPDVSVPGLLREDIQEICLSIKTQSVQYSIQDFLADAIEPPSPEVVASAIAALNDLGALTGSEQLTSLGHLLSNLPVHPRLGKLIILGIIYKCLDSMIIIGATGDHHLFQRPIGLLKQANKIRHGFSSGSGSDPIAALHAINRLMSLQRSKGDVAAVNYAYDNFLSIRAYRTIISQAGQIETILEEAGLIPSADSEDPTARAYFRSLNENSGNVSLIKALLAWVFHPNVARLEAKHKYYYKIHSGRCTMLHPSAVSFRREQGESAPELMTYGTLLRDNEDSMHFIRNTSEISPLVVALFGGPLTLSQIDHLYKFRPKIDRLQMGGWLDLGIPRDPESQRRFGSPAWKTIADFRSGLRRMEIEAFRTLGKGGRIEGAEDKVRSYFVDALVEILHDEAEIAATTRESARAKGEEGLAWWIGRNVLGHEWPRRLELEPIEHE